MADVKVGRAGLKAASERVLAEPAAKPSSRRPSIRTLISTQMSNTRRAVDMEGIEEGSEEEEDWTESDDD